MDFAESIRKLMLEAQNYKSKASEEDRQDIARRWAIVNTDLEKVLAYVIYNLVEESEE